MSDCYNDDDWPSERHLHGGTVRSRTAYKRPIPPAVALHTDEPSSPLTVIEAFQTVELCDRCARAYGLPV